ncbi:MAG TPA: hypothetical protein VK506_13455 [Conexibacter sp.]|nr:hypothetical protein [Conexibacter sp.]
MRRLAILASLAALAGVLLARRRRLRQAMPLDAPARRSDPGLPPVEAASSEPAAGASRSGYVSVAWTLVSAPADRAELALRCHQDDELALERVDVQETPSQVFVTALAQHLPRDRDEPARGEADAIVVLSHPLGARELIPAPVDAEPDAPPLYP